MTLKPVSLPCKWPKRPVGLLCVVLMILCNVTVVFAQYTTPLFADISNNNSSIISGHLKQGTNHNLKGDTLTANSSWFIKNNKPWFPIMGEFHYERFPKEQWEESILKMKAAGIDIIATYVFWIYHEEVKGSWDWVGRNDLKYFASLCKKHQIYLLLRIGPWCHGEVRNGGFPDWLLTENLKTRSNDSLYLFYTRLLYQQIHNQAKDYYFKYDGTIIGIQFENEFKFDNENGLAHMLGLKKTGVSIGMDVPYYTATGWPSPDLKQTDLIPMWGGYPEAPWNSSTKELPLSEKFKFDSLYRIDKTIGNDLIHYAANGTVHFSGYHFPYSTAELGGGIQVTYHRRPIIEPADVTSIAYFKTGSGANLLGYYMFHGGTNRVGKLTTLQESKASGYPNDYAIINYDFQAPLGQWGERQASYNPFKKLHLFLNDFGSELATTTAFFPTQKIKNQADTSTLRWAVRSNGSMGFVFISNYQRLLRLPEFKSVQFTLKLNDTSAITFPDKPFTVPSGVQMLMPFNLDLQGAKLSYATAQPLCILKNSVTTYVFYEQDGVEAMYAFDAKNIQSIKGPKNVLIKKDGDKCFVSIIKPGLGCRITITVKGGSSIQLLTITNQHALQAYKFTIGGKQRLFITDGGLILNGNKLCADIQGNTAMDIWVYPNDGSIKCSQNKLAIKQDGVFQHYAIHFPKKVFGFSLTKIENATAGINTASNVGHKPLYKQTLKYLDSAVYWQFRINNLDFTGLKDVIVEAHYQSDTYAAYLNNYLIADEFYYGHPFTVSLRQFKNQIRPEGLIFQLTSFSSNAETYFSKSVRDTMQRDKAIIQSIKLIPEYEAVLIYDL